MKPTLFKRAYSPREVLSKRINRLTLPNAAWSDLLGPQRDSGVWFVWGNSGNGKTEFVMRLLSLFTEMDRTLYLSLEEGIDNDHLHTALRRNKLDESRNLLISFDTIEELTARLSMEKSPRVVLVDTVQYWGISYDEYRELKSRFPGKLFVFISHVSQDGRQPDGSAAQRIKRDSDLRLWVEGFKAFNLGRTMGTTNEYTIWEVGAARYWGNKTKNTKSKEE